MIKNRRSFATGLRYVGLRQRPSLLGRIAYARWSQRYANPRSWQAQIKLEAFGFAIADATKALELDPNYVKVSPIMNPTGCTTHAAGVHFRGYILTRYLSQAYWRRALANTAILSYKAAVKDFKAVVKREPANQNAKLKLAECEKLVRRMEFEKAIEVSDPPSAFEDLDIDAIKVEEAYDGVRLGEEMTQEFIDDMIGRFKNGKKIHRKYVFQIIKAVKDLVYNEPTMVEIGVEAGKKLTVCGDTHGMRNLWRLEKS